MPCMDQPSTRNDSMNQQLRATSTNLMSLSSQTIQHKTGRMMRALKLSDSIKKWLRRIKDHNGMVYEPTANTNAFTTNNPCNKNSKHQNNVLGKIKKGMHAMGFRIFLPTTILYNLKDKVDFEGVDNNRIRDNKIMTQ